MTKRKILVVGNCNRDGPRIVAMINHNLKNAEAIEAKTIEKAKEILQRENYDLVLVNRIGDSDKINGLELVGWMQQNTKEQIKKTPIMLITNYSDKMKEAEKHGAVHGFGKEKIDDSETLKLLEKHLK